MTKLHAAAACVAALFLASAVFSHTVALRLALLAIGIVLASIVVAKDRHVRALPPIWIPFVLWGAWALLSLGWSIEPERTLKEWRNEVFYTGAALWICYVGAQAAQAARVFWAIVCAAAAAASIIALREFLAGWYRYLEGWHGGPGDHSSALLTLFPCVVAATWYIVRKRLPLWAVLCMFILAGLMLASAYTTLSRTVWLGIAAEFALLSGWLLTRARVVLSARTKAIAIALAVAAVIGCLAMVVNIQAERYSVSAGRAVEADARLALWPGIIRRAVERPYTGYGLGRGILHESLQAEFKAVDKQLWHAHNLLLEALVQLGVPGLALLLVLLGALARAAWRLMRNVDELTAACGVALLAMVVGMLARNMTDALLGRQNALLFWGIAGVLLGLSARRSRAELGV